LFNFVRRCPLSDSGSLRGLELDAPPPGSGRTMARTGLRMMPTFPSSPLKFRTAGFPRYGFKAGLSAGTFPRAAPTYRALPVYILPSCPPLSAFRSPLCVGATVRSSTAIQAAMPLYPGALAPVRVLLSRSINTYAAPSAPLAGTVRFHRPAAYTPCLRCAFPPRRPTTGSVLSPLILSEHVALYDSGDFSGCIHPVPSPPTLAFVPLAQTRHSQNSHKSVSRGRPFRSFTTVRFRYDLLICSPS
jgi:hypothetical protein